MATVVGPYNEGTAALPHVTHVEPSKLIGKKQQTKNFELLFAASTSMRKFIKPMARTIVVL